MDWMFSMQSALDYIEAHITEKINCEHLAKAAYSSSYHFQRVFALTCGISLGEYIRRRKLTLAGNDLIGKRMKVTEVAFKYGYDTLESFSRAFVRFHGILPSRVKSMCQ